MNALALLAVGYLVWRFGLHRKATKSLRSVGHPKGGSAGGLLALLIVGLLVFGFVVSLATIYLVPLLLVVGADLIWRNRQRLQLVAKLSELWAKIHTGLL
jgi:hypothetical protein